MDWLDEVRIKLKKRSQVLFAKDTEFLQDLTMLFREQNHKTMVLWFCSRNSVLSSCRYSVSLANKT